MSQLSAIVDALIASGASAAQIGAVVRAAEQERDSDQDKRNELRLERQRERTRKSRAVKELEKSRDVTVGNVTTGDVTLQPVTDVTKVPPKEIPPTPPKEITPSKTLAPLGNISNISAREWFLRFISVYPKRIEKKTAETKFIAAVRGGVEPQHIVDAASRYADQCRETEPQFIKSPVVWLNKGCWDDEDLPPARAGPSHGNGRWNPTEMLEQLKSDDQSPDEHPIPNGSPKTVAGFAGRVGDVLEPDRKDRGGALFDFGFPRAVRN